MFVAWNTQTIPPPNPPQDPRFFNPNVIMASVSDDGGTSFAAPIIVNDDRYASAEPPGPAASDPTRYSQPNFVFLPGRAGDPTSGGRMLTLFSDFGVNALNPITGTRVVSDERRFTPTTIPHVVEVTNNNSQLINTVGQTLFPLNLTNQLGSLTAIHQLSVTLNINHNALQELLVELVAPNGTTAATLFLNGVNAAGQAIQPPQGIDGNQLGRINNRNVGTTFQDNAARTIRMGTAPGSAPSGPRSAA